MKPHLKALALAFSLILLVTLTLNAQAQSDDSPPDIAIPHVLHIHHTFTTTNPTFPQSLFMSHVMDGAQSKGSIQALHGTLSLKNQGPEFSEVLWLLAYWQGTCPPDDQALTGTNFLWSEIQKNPIQSESTLPVDLHFPRPLPTSGCIGFIFAGGPLVQGAPAVSMSADLDLEYQPSDTTSANTVVDLSGEYCFGQNWGCQNATTNEAQAFAVPVTLPVSGHLTELYGDISDSTVDGSDNFGPLPKTGAVWGVTNNLYLLPGGCGAFGNNLNDQGFPNPVLLSTLNSWLPANAVHLESVPMDYQILPDRTSKAPLTRQVETFLPYPVKVNAGDCVVVIYGRKGNGATDNETQIHALITP